MKGPNICTCISGYNGPSCQFFDCVLLNNCTSITGNGNCIGNLIAFSIFFFSLLFWFSQELIFASVILDLLAQVVPTLIAQVWMTVIVLLEEEIALVVFKYIIKYNQI